MWRKIAGSVKSYNLTLTGCRSDSVGSPNEVQRSEFNALLYFRRLSMSIETIEKLEHVLKMNEPSMTSTGVVYIKESIADVKKIMKTISEIKQCVNLDLAFTLCSTELEAVRRDIKKAQKRLNELTEI